MIPIPRVEQPPRIDRISTRDWLKGTVTAYDDGRTPIEGLRASGNTYLDQDGILRPRPSLLRYGAQPTGTVLGEVYEFVRMESGTPINYMLIMQNIAGTTKPAYAKDGEAWTTINGKTYDNDAPAHFVQVDEKVMVMNGVDNLSYIDLPTLAVIPYVALATPSAPSIAQTGMAGTTYTYYYKVTANSTVGETAASVADSEDVSMLRDVWDATTNYLTITWSAVVGAQSYNVYVGDVAGQETLVASGINGLSFKDDGSNARDITRVAPVGDSTAGPKVTRGTVINSQAFFTGDTDFPQYVRYGGNTADSILDLSPYNGGGYSEIGKGTKDFPVRVMAFRDGRGNSTITVLCRGTNGTGKRYVMSPDSITVATTIISFFSVTEDNGQDGTSSPDGVILYRDSLWYPSKDGFKTTGTKPQLQNILSTNSVSQTIAGDIANLNSDTMDKCVGLAVKDRLYWLLPVGSEENSEMWVMDLERKGAWMKPWTIAGSWQMLYNSNDGSSHHIVVKDSVILELTHAQATLDDGVAFSTNVTSGFLKFSEDGLDWAKVIDVTFVLLRPQGQINFTISGRTEDSSLQTLGNESFVSSATIAGWGEAGWGGAEDQIFGWSDFGVVPVQYGDAQRYVTVEIDEELQWLTWEINTDDSGVDYRLADVIVRYVKIGVKDLT